MLVNMMLNDSLMYTIGIFGVLGIVSKLVVSMTLNRLVKSASNMSKSNHKFMKLVKAKFEHATMANNGVDNVPVFVDKYIHEYKTLGLTIHSWQKIQRIALAIVMISGAMGSALAWYLGFGSSSVIQYSTVGIGATIILLAMYQIVDEKHRIMGLRIYMVDYLENVLSSRYEKAKSSNRVSNRVQIDENSSQLDGSLNSEADTKILPDVSDELYVDNFYENNEYNKGTVDNFATESYPNEPINYENQSLKTPEVEPHIEEKIVVTNTGFGWKTEGVNRMEKALFDEGTTGAITEASYTGVTAHEATNILGNRMQGVRAVQVKEPTKDIFTPKTAPKFHIQTLEEESRESQLTTIEQMLQEEAQKRTIAKEQAGTKSTVNSTMIREILEEFMS